jgi:hypothetical protein
MHSLGGKKFLNYIEGMLEGHKIIFSGILLQLLLTHQNFIFQDAMTILTLFLHIKNYELFYALLKNIFIVSDEKKNQEVLLRKYEGNFQHSNDYKRSLSYNS